MQPPSSSKQQVLRIKRKRTEDPLQALLVDSTNYSSSTDSSSGRSSKRSKPNGSSGSNVVPSKVIFKLARTDEKTITSAVDLSSVLERSTGNVFSLPKTEVASNEVNPELLDMLNDYLKVNGQSESANGDSINEEGIQKVNSHPKRPNRRLSSTIIPKTQEQDDQEYVYDVYLRDTEDSQSSQPTPSNVGYIYLQPNEIHILLDSGTTSAASSPGGENRYTDDEDSNDENFYRNDYPEDEDGGYGGIGGEEDDEFGDNSDSSDSGSDAVNLPSDDQDDEFVIAHDKRRFTERDLMASEGVTDDLLLKTNDDDDNDVYMGGENVINEGEEDEYRRNHFFASDVDNPLAVHRDKIFGKLERMIKEDR